MHIVRLLFKYNVQTDLNTVYTIKFIVIINVKNYIAYVGITMSEFFLINTHFIAVQTRFIITSAFFKVSLQIAIRALWSKIIKNLLIAVKQ